MSSGNPGGPTSPRLTFDSYVIPETVQEYGPAPAAPHVNGMLTAACIIAVLTFFLGVMTTLRFVGPDQIADTTGGENAPAPSNAEQLASANFEQTVTRETSADMLTPSPSPRTEPAMSSPEVAVLQGLQSKRTVGTLTDQEPAQRSQQEIETVSPNNVDLQREGTLAGISTVETKENAGKRRLVLRTINADESAGTLASLLRRAAEEGQIEIPASLNTADGEVDIDMLLFNLIQTSLVSDGTAAGAEAAREMSRRAMAGSNAKTREIKGERIYIVEPGDSLAYISLQFYGLPDSYTRIFEANRKVLDSPDRIQIGQRLIIPG